MTEPELLASGRERPPSPAVHRTLPWLIAGLVVVVLIVVAAAHDGHQAARTRAARPAATPVARPTTERAPSAAPVAADLARVLVDPARHRLRLIFTIFNAQTTRVVLLHVGAADAGLFVRRASFARFQAAGSWQPARLPLALSTGQSAHVQLDYGVRGCPTSATARLQVPALIASREQGRVDVDLAALVPPHDWTRGLIDVLCPISSR